MNGLPWEIFAANPLFHAGIEIPSKGAAIIPKFARYSVFFFVFSHVSHVRKTKMMSVNHNTAVLEFKIISKLFLFIMLGNQSQDSGCHDACQVVLSS